MGCPINNEDRTFHREQLRYANIATGVVENNVLKTELDLGSSLETHVDATQDFLSPNCRGRKNVFDVGAEFLYKTDNFFTRGEYMYKHVTKERDDRALFEANLGSIDFGVHSKHGRKVIRLVRTLSTELISKPVTKSSAIRINTAIPMLLLKGLNGRALEVVARYSYTGLNDLVEGENIFPDATNTIPTVYWQTIRPHH